MVKHMLRTFLTGSIVVMTALLVAVVCFRGCNESQPQGKLTDRQKQFSNLPDAPVKPKAELPAVVKEINERNSNIKAISCDDLEMKIWLNGHRYRLTGSLHYEKPRNFRMEISSILGKEVDVGSNQQVFWYWSRRDKDPGLHWAKHEDLEKTRLKTPFNPAFLRATLGVEILPSENVKVIEKGKDIMLVYPRTGANGEPLLFAVFVNKDKKRVDGYVVTNNSGQTVAACEVQEYSNGLPTKILYNWYEEGRVMLMVLNRPKLNPSIPPSVWQMPNIERKVNMAEQ